MAGAPHRGGRCADHLCRRRLGLRPVRHDRAAQAFPDRRVQQDPPQPGRFLVLGLEFQLAGDVLRTAVAPSFTEIGQLAAIAAIRTILNFFLTREIAQERAEIEGDRKEPLPQASAPVGV
ncbi:DUF1622 domain-containing protein [Streptomyces virginiae]|uniref:DUF1622 domain-containing protein n=1 Tax=Streptomyces virginiae TaxID=1961 RepID=UPI00345D27A6